VSTTTAVNPEPRTEEVIGHVADAAAGEMPRSIAAARRAFDDTDWVPNQQQLDEPLGYKQSGIDRQNGILGFEQYLETKAVAWPVRDT
jgi:aldehyde dehydrogenase (NAD+)